jgi:hypothetical protein
VHPLGQDKHSVRKPTRAATVREKDFYVQTQIDEPIAPPSKLLALTEIGRAAIESPWVFREARCKGRDTVFDGRCV